MRTQLLVWFCYLWAVEPFRFIMIGGLTVVLNYLLFVALYELAGIPYVEAFWIAFVPTFVLSFILHKSHTFRHVGSHRVLFRFALFAAKQLALAKLDEVLLVYFVERWQVPPWFMQGCLTLVISGASYFLTKLIFHQRPRRS